MLWSTEELKGLQLTARDGEVGRVTDVYFDDERWAVRYLVVNTGSWFAGRKVLLSPHAVERLDREDGRLVLALTQRQIEQAPSIDTDKPVSRQNEQDFNEHYGYPGYWAGTRLWGGLAFPVPMLEPVPVTAVDPVAAEMGEREEQEREHADPHLRSAAEVAGYSLHARDGSIGRIEDFLFDGRSWAIEALVVDSRPWWPGGEVLLPRTVVAAIDWTEREARVGVDRQTVKNAPPWSRDAATRDDSVLAVQRHFERAV